MQEIQIKTRSSVEMVDITSQVEKVIQKSGIQKGACIVFVPHTTAGITINENADPAVIRDILMELNMMRVILHGVNLVIL